MKKKFTPWIALACLLASALACNMPGTTEENPYTLPTTESTASPAVLLPTYDGGAASEAPTERTPTAPGAIPTQGEVISTALPATVPAVASAPAPAQATTAQPPATLTPTASPVPPTASPTATISYAGPEVRSGPSITAIHLTHPPMLDGNFEDWNMDKTAIESVVLGAQKWSGAQDASGRAMFGWDQENLYIAVRVKDDVFMQSFTGKRLFRGDSLEILVDTNVAADFYRQALDADDYQVGISAGSPQPGAGPESFLWYPENLGTKDNNPGLRVKAAAMPTDDGYRVEAAIPWRIFGVTPRAGAHLGFAFSIADNDHANQDMQESMVSNVPTRKLEDPTTWGDLTLSGVSQTPTPQRRIGAVFEAAHLPGRPTLDGDLSEWTAAPYPVNHLVFGDDKWDDDRDLSGKAWLGWDEQNFYLAAVVVDNRYVQRQGGENLFLGDSLEILLDTNVAKDFYEQLLDADDFQLGISPGNPTPGASPESYLWYPRDKAGPQPRIELAVLPAEDGYTIEAIIPWSLFGVIPVEGQHFGFAFSISDNDHAQKDIQQSMLSLVRTRVLSDPTTWGDLVLK